MSELLNTGGQVPSLVDAGRPWPGLFHFTENQSLYFFGRDHEVRELFDCVKRDAITLLYGKSGLGKSSLLQAGLFPRLRQAAFLPVYIRLRYDDTFGSLESQVMSALRDDIETADFAEVASPGPDESLWEYLHHRGNLIDSSGNVVCPVFVFDQFEEVFTLGERNQDAKRLRDQFIVCLANLVENTIPQELSKQLADNPGLAAKFDFSAIGCRFIVSLREEYVTRLDDLRRIPSLSSASSRISLKEMNGEQALQVVSGPNPELVTDEVAELIVRFVGGDTTGKAVEELEVAPAILSLFCRELSIERGDAPQITPDLVRGSAGTIIDDFYRRCVNSIPATVQRLIEDELVTESGYRNSVDLYDARRELEAAGVSGSVIDDLVNQRLLHIEEIRGMPRLELTHDVLLEPVNRSRGERQKKEAREREEAKLRDAREEAERRVEAERGRARFLRRLAAVALVAVLMVSILAIYAWQQRQAALANAAKAQAAERLALDNAAKAQAAEEQARKAREMAAMQVRACEAQLEKKTTKNAGSKNKP